jgi:hypothetical protein
MEKSTNKKGFFGLLSNNSHWIATILLISGFVLESIDSQGVLNGKSFHQLIVAPVLLLMGYSLFIFVVLKKLKI